jgi:c-di-GMP-binding flagellar brake protein YcgR
MPDNSYNDKTGESFIERREYQRIKGDSPVHYFTRISGSWSDAELEDYSAGGICFRCNETLQEETELTIQIKQDHRNNVPAMAVSAVVVRCSTEGEHQFKVACKFNRELSINPPPHLRFLPGSSY